MSCGTCGIQASDTMQGDTGVPAGAPTTGPQRCPPCQAFRATAGAPCRNPRCPTNRARAEGRPPRPSDDPAAPDYTWENHLAWYKALARSCATADEFVAQSFTATGEPASLCAAYLTASERGLSEKIRQAELWARVAQQGNDSEAMAVHNREAEFIRVCLQFRVREQAALGARGGRVILPRFWRWARGDTPSAPPEAAPKPRRLKLTPQRQALVDLMAHEGVRLVFFEGMYPSASLQRQDGRREPLRLSTYLFFRERGLIHRVHEGYPASEYGLTEAGAALATPRSPHEA